ncbi:preprotein translocase subunit SecE [SAR202 cluster bacterium AC-647-N09_OGT_505m]|nr:preprotein translocase subunit SecE [SAR202 cluster bacterium AC-647-N09_OGT_505m]
MARAPARRSTGSETVRRRPGFQFLRETVGELKRVVWPTREQTTRLTILVIIISLAVGILLGVVDLGFGRLFRILI